MLVILVGVHVVDPADYVDLDLADMPLVLVLELLHQYLAGLLLVLLW